jgi:hypothetical protein
MEPIHKKTVSKSGASVPSKWVRKAAGLCNCLQISAESCQWLSEELLAWVPAFRKIGRNNDSFH